MLVSNNKKENLIRKYERLSNDTNRLREMNDHPLSFGRIPGRQNYHHNTTTDIATKTMPTESTPIAPANNENINI